MILQRHPFLNSRSFQVYEPRQFQREIGVHIVLVDFSRGISEQNHVKPTEDAMSDIRQKDAVTQESKSQLKPRLRMRYSRMPRLILLYSIIL